MAKVDASTAKRSMGQFDGKCKTLVNEAKTFAATHAAGLTEGGKKKAANLEDELKNQFSRMERRWDEFGDDLEINDQTTFNDLDRKVQAARQAVKEAKDALYDLIDKPTVVAHAAQPAQAPKMAPKLVTNFKPGILPSSTNLNEFNAWEKSFVAYMDANKDFLAASANQTKRIFVTTLLDAKIQGALDADETMSADTIPIKSDNEDDVTLLKWLRTYILRYLPLYIRRYHYSLVKQLPKESFQDFLQRKILKGRECDLENINAEAVQITELIIGINNNKLREDFLKLKDPKLADLIDLGLQSDLATAVKKDNFGEASVNKTSEYQNSKKLNWNANKNNSNHGKNSGGSSGGGGNHRHNSQGGNHNKGQKFGRTKFDNPCKSCGSNYCGGSPCMYKDSFCPACGKKGHTKFATFCPSYIKAKKAATDSKSTSKAVRVTVRKAVAFKVKENLDDCAPTPICNMQFKIGNGKSFNHDVLPDTGCSQSLISLDIAEANGIQIDWKKKKNIRNASDEPMVCDGTVVFGLEHQGISTKVEALVTSDLTNEVLLGWKTLKRLRIIPEDFPNPIFTPFQPRGNSIPKGQNSVLAARAERVDSITEVVKTLPGVQHQAQIRGPRCLKFFCKESLYLGDDPRSNVEVAMAAFPEVFKEPTEADGGLKTMKGEPMKIQLKPVEITPTQIYTARKVPYAFESLAKDELNKLEALGVIEFCGYEASDWCSPCSFVRKPGGGVRSVVDLKGLNKFVMRPTHPFPTGKDIIATIPPTSKFFAVFDALKGYWQVELAEESRHLTTFLTEFGRYRYLRAPMGLNASGDEFCLRTDKAVAGLPGVKKLVDDILVFADTHEALLDNIIGLFKRCQENCITLSRSKFQYGNSVKFAGFIVDDEGYRPDPSKVSSIKDFPVPKDLTNLKSFMGLVNQFASFNPDLKHLLAPLQPLLKPSNKFQWLEEHQRAFEVVKEILTRADGPLLRHFDPKLPVTLTTDASRIGLGFILTQKDTSDNVGLVQAGSRFLSPAERNYAVIELEAMAIQWAILKCRSYLLGVEFNVLTDHKPLLGVMNGKDLDSINNGRLQRMISKLVGYQYNVEYLPGKMNFIADALSRSPVFQPEANELHDVLIQTLRVEAGDPQLEAIVEAAVADPIYQQVIKAVSSKADWKNLPHQHPARLYRNQWDFLAVEKDVGLLTVNGRIVIPRAAQKAVLAGIHHQHTGQVKTYKNACQMYFWPQMKRDVHQMVSNCPDCVAFLPSKPLPPLVQTKASRPFEAMSLDLAYFEGVHYLVAVDRFSGWINVAKLTKLDTAAVTNPLEDWNLTFGKPQRLRTDGGPQFRSEFVKWCETNGIIHELSSPEHHQSNGHAENAVKSVKYLLGKVDGNFLEFRKCLHEWRNTPRSVDGLSPAQWAWGRRQRSEAPALEAAYERLSDQDFFEALNKRGDSMAKTKLKFDQNRKPEPELPIGTKKNGKPGRWNLEGTIVSKRTKGNSYWVDVDGHGYLRSRLFIRLAPNPNSEVNADGESSQADTSNPNSERLRRSERIKKKNRRSDSKKVHKD